MSVFDQREDVTVVKLPYFGDEEHEGIIERAIPTITVQTVDGPVKVTTVYDLILANYGIDRGIGGEVATAYTDDTPYTPTWQEKITGVKADIAIATAREFADNAEKTKGSFHDYHGWWYQPLVPCRCYLPYYFEPYHVLWYRRR